MPEYIDSSGIGLDCIHVQVNSIMELRLFIVIAMKRIIVEVANEETNNQIILIALLEKDQWLLF